MRRLNRAVSGVNDFLHKWAATIFFVGFMFAQVATVHHLMGYRTEVIQTNCDNRKTGRDDLRSILVEIVERVAGDEERLELLVSIEENYPTLEC